MKKLIVTLAALVVASGAFAQLNYGVRAGANLSSISGMVEEENLDYGDLVTASATQSSKLGMNFGIFAEYMLMPMLGVQAEVNFSMQGVNTHVNVSGTLLGGELKNKNSFMANYVNVPVLAKFHFANIRLFAGPQLGFLAGDINVKSKTTSGEETKIEKDDLDDDLYSGIDFSFVVGGQYKFTENIGVDARYNIGLTNVFPTQKNDKGVVLSEGYGKQGVLQIGVFYEF